MNSIKLSFEIIDQKEGIDGVEKQIELAGRTCYKSEDRITSDSAKLFVEKMIKSDHSAMLEHGTVYLESNNSEGMKSFALMSKYQSNKYSIVKIKGYDDDLNNRGIPFKRYLITTNYRVLVENDWLDDLKYQCEPTKYHERRVTVKFIMDRVGSQSFVRHRVFSFGQESTRFCNYIRDKFKGTVSFIIPSYIREEDIQEAKNDLSFIESLYFKWIKKGYKAEQARFVLPFATKTELIMTGYISDWKHFFKLRGDKSAHSQARELVIPLIEEFEKRNYI